MMVRAEGRAVRLILLRPLDLAWFEGSRGENRASHKLELLDDLSLLSAMPTL